MACGIWWKLSLLYIFVSVCKGQEDPCSVRDAQASCDACIQIHPDCVWCSYNPGPNGTGTMNFRRCLMMDDMSSCPGGLSAIENPPVNLVNTRNANLSMEAIVGQESVQVRPQALNMTLRRGQPQSFSMSFIALRNTPVDVYFLLDVSASLVLTFNALRENLQIIADSISDISSAYQIGIGGFVDKNVFPYGGTSDYYMSFGSDPRVCPQDNMICSPPLGYRHYLKLTSNVTKFQEVLDNELELAINADSPEGGLDALMQMAVCNDIIGWRPDALRMVFLVTDNDFHIAGDGYLAGLFKPNDGKCHMEEIPGSPGQYDYAFSTVQDYPSIHQLLAALQESLIVPTFGIQQSFATNTNLRAYELLSEELRTLQASAIGIDSMGNSSSTAQAIIELINNAYEATSQTIQVVIPSIEGYQVTVEPLDCQLVTTEGACMVNFSDIITFNVTVELTDCDAAGVETIELRGAPYVFSDIVVHPSCDCECSAEEFHIPMSESCSGVGTEICSACQCDQGRSGDFCECDSATVGICPEFNGMECGGPERGMCSSCGECMCIPPYFGAEQGCKCDNETCSEGCRANGTCMCAADPFCQCTGLAPISKVLLLGEDCCDPDPICFNTDVNGVSNLRLCQVLDNLTIAGMCSPDCSRCDCSFEVTGVPDLEESSGLCLPMDLCAFFEPCAREVLSGGGVTVDGGCAFHPNIRLMDEDEEIDGSLYAASGCPFIWSNDGCTYEFLRGINPFAIDVIVDNVPVSCPPVLPNWAPYVIAAAAVVAIILIGLILICLLKLCVVLWDKREFKKFTQELQHADFAPHENPLYLTPQQDYQNPILRRHSSKRKS